MITWGINALNHDASIAIVNDGNLVFWKSSSEYSGIKGDGLLNQQLIDDAIHKGIPDEIVWYERPWLKKTRQIYAGQWNWAFNINEIPSVYLKRFNLHKTPISYLPHHLSHAASGFLTSPYDKATIVVLDGIGEWESATIWKGEGTNLSKLWSRSYPTSLGIFYSAFTKLLGLNPLSEEHILQKLSLSGNPIPYYYHVKYYWKDDVKLRFNLHKGVVDWHIEINENNRADIAASVQMIFEEKANEIMNIAKALSPYTDLVFMGGCAMNSKFRNTLFNNWGNVWSLPNSGDISSAIGAALYKQQIRLNLTEI